MRLLYITWLKISPNFVYHTLSSCDKGLTVYFMTFSVSKWNASRQFGGQSNNQQQTLEVIIIIFNKYRVFVGDKQNIQV